VAVIGGSAAGLAAALQLARQRRTVVVVDDGTPRNAPAAHMHGYLGREGAPPAELVAIGRAEVRGYGGEVVSGRALAVLRDGDGRFKVELTGGHTLAARRVLAATGIVDELPDIDGLAGHWGRGVIHCPFCHGFEVRDRRLVQIVTHPMGLHQTPLLRHLTDRLTVVLDDSRDAGSRIDEDAVAALAVAGTPVVRDRVGRVVSGPDGEVAGVELAGGRTLAADAVVVGPRFRGRAEALATAGVTTTPHPTGLGDALDVDPRGETAVPGIYAAGNLTDPTMQVLQAAAHGSRVGSMIAFSLAADDLSAGVRTSGGQADWDLRYGGEDRVWSPHPNGTLAAEVADVPPARALDIGAGEGADALWLAERGWRVTACDISGNALARVAAEAGRRGLDVRCLRADANDLDAFGPDTYDLVSLQYGSFLRTPDQRGLRNVLATVAPGGTLLVVGHDLAPVREPLDVTTQTRMYDPEAYVGVDEFAAALDDDASWKVEVHETRPRPPGAASTHHVDDVVLRATRRPG
jgi:thioredoxin reductase/SAM-dependent methyltransferase